MISPKTIFDWRAVFAGTAALAAGAISVKLFPSLEEEIFARGAAKLVGLFTGTPVFRGATGWIVPLAHAPVVVTPACSATDYFCMVAGLIGFQLAHRRTRPFAAFFLALGTALPVTVFVNAVRIVTVAHAHPWFISRLPATYEAFLHLATGAAVFLPSLIALNLLFEIYGRSRSPVHA